MTDSEYELPEESGTDLAAILAEMEAQGAAFEAVFQKGDRSRAADLAHEALSLLKGTPQTVEDHVTRFAMEHIAGTKRLEPLVAHPSSDPSDWSQRTFEAFALGWSRWLATGDPSVLSAVAHARKTEEEATNEPDALSLSLWGSAIEALVYGDLEVARSFFEQSTEVGAQFATNANPLVCWTFAASFF